MLTFNRVKGCYFPVNYDCKEKGPFFTSLEPKSQLANYIPGKLTSFPSNWNLSENFSSPPSCQIYAFFPKFNFPVDGCYFPVEENFINFALVTCFLLTGKLHFCSLENNIRGKNACLKPFLFSKKCSKIFSK